MANQNKNIQLGILGILLGLVGIIISLLLPVIEISLSWVKNEASAIDIGVMFFYLILAFILFILEVKVYKKAFPSKVMKEKDGTFNLVILELAIIFSVIQINDFIPKSTTWAVAGMIVLIVALVYRIHFLKI